jgi:hypothetical protein
MPNPLSREKKELRRKKTLSKKLLPIKKPETKRSMRLNLKPRESKTRRKKKFKDLESSKRRLPIDNLKSMPSEPREPSKKVRDKLGREKDSSIRRGRESKLILRLLEMCSSKRNRVLWPSKLELRERTTCYRSKSKSKSSSKRERSRKRRRMLLLITL